MNLSRDEADDAIIGLSNFASLAHGLIKFQFRGILWLRSGVSDMGRYDSLSKARPGATLLMELTCNEQKLCPFSFQAGGICLYFVGI